MDFFPPNLDWSSIASFLCGSGGVTFVLRLVIKHAIDQLHQITRELKGCTQKLVILETELRALETLRETVREHDRKILALELRCNHGRHDYS